MIDLTAAAAEVARLARAVRDNDLDGPTACAGTSVAVLLDLDAGVPRRGAQDDRRREHRARVELSG